MKRMTETMAPMQRLFESFVEAAGEFARVKPEGAEIPG